MLFTKQKRHLSSCQTKIKFQILVKLMWRTNFHALGCSHSYTSKTKRSLETRLSEHANIKSYRTSAITQHLLNCPDALYLANLNAFPDLDSSEEFPAKIHCPTLLVYTNSKIVFSCKCYGTIFNYHKYSKGINITHTKVHTQISL